VRLYLSSFRIGNRPDELRRLLRGRKRTALILNADDYKPDEVRAASLRRELDELKSNGLDPVEVDLREYFTKPDELVPALSSVDLIYVRGGNVFILRRAFKQSGADQLIKELLATDAVVYGGYSAGGCVLGPTLRGISGDLDDPDFIPDGYEPGPPIWDGLGVLPYVIAPHYKSDPFVTPEVDRCIEYFIAHHIPFIALRDGEAIVVDGGRDTVIG
jgi:dipeptidase E